MGEGFEGSRRRLVAENERKYGREARERYGDEAVDAGNAKLMGLTRKQYEKALALSSDVNAILRLAVQAGDPAGPLARQCCALHREWLGYFWKEVSEAHLGRRRPTSDRGSAGTTETWFGGAAFLLQAGDLYAS